MKNIISTLILLVSISSVSSMEIQCDSPWKDVLAVIKKSSNSNTSYLLFMGEVEVETYYTLPETSYLFNEEQFHFSDKDTQISINFSRSAGEISSVGLLFRETGKIPLHNCRNITLKQK